MNSVQKVLTDTATDLDVDPMPDTRPELIAWWRRQALAYAHSYLRCVACNEQWLTSNPQSVFVVYIAVNMVNGKMYVGSSLKFLRRISSHFSDASNGSKFPFHYAIRKYGRDNFVFVPRGYHPTEAEMKAGERATILEERSQDPELGYNIADGGDGIGRGGALAVHARPEYREKLLATRFERGRKAKETRIARLASGYYAMKSKLI